MFVVVLILISFFSVLDGSLSSAFLLLAGFVFGYILSATLPKEHQQKGRILYNIVFSIYVVLAYIVSLSFSASEHFLVSDSSRYIESYIGRVTFDPVLEDYINYYIEFGDYNLLYNSYLNVMAMFANTKLDGMTVFGMTLLQTVWGTLSSIVLFRILTRHIDVKKAFRYTLFFAFGSLFLFYSTVIIRDIVICFLYLCAFDIVDRSFSLLGVIKLVALIILAWGVRLYSGIFMVAFLAYYLYVRFRNSQFKTVATIIFVAVMIAVGVGVISSSLMEQTTAELQGYEELSAERSAGGIVSKLQSLPFGISQLAIMLFTMIRPLPPFGIYTDAETFSHFTMSTMCLVAGFFWFVLFYSFCFLLFFKKYLFKISFETIVLLTICVVFMLANTSHPDIRRMLPVFPILFVHYSIICERNGITILSGNISKALMAVYAIMAIGLYFSL